MKLISYKAMKLFIVASARYFERACFRNGFSSESGVLEVLSEPISGSEALEKNA
jgi:hypothetical protein